MRLLALVALAASAAPFAPALAQTVPDQDPYYGVAPDRAPPPPAHMRQGPPPGATWHGPPPQMQMQAPQMHMQMQNGMPQQRQNFVLHRMGPGQGMERRHVEYRH